MRPPTGLETDAIVQRLQRDGYVSDVSLEMAAQAARQAETACHLRTCPDSSRIPEGIELSRHPARKEGSGCGYQMARRNRRNPALRQLWRKPCRIWSCPDCGPWFRREKVRRYLEKLDGFPLWLAVIARDRWPTLARRLKRHGAEHLRIPAPGDMVVVIATTDIGEPVTDLAAALAEAINAKPADGSRITSSDAWKLSGAGSDDDADDDPEWIWEAPYSLPIEQAVEVGKEWGYYDGPVQTGGYSVAHQFRFPEDDPLAWRRFRRRIGLSYDPPKRRRRPKVEAA
jgi:hypothetical protein